MTEPKYNVKKLKELFKEWCEEEIIITGAKDVKDSIAETAKEKLGIEKAEFNALAKLYYDKEYAPSKFDKAKEKAEYISVVESL